MCQCSRPHRRRCRPHQRRPHKDRRIRQGRQAGCRRSRSRQQGCHRHHTRHIRRFASKNHRPLWHLHRSCKPWRPYSPKHRGCMNRRRILLKRRSSQRMGLCNRRRAPPGPPITGTIHQTPRRASQALTNGQCERYNPRGTFKQAHRWLRDVCPASHRTRPFELNVYDAATVHHKI